MLNVDDALAVILENATPLESEAVSVADCSGRVLARSVDARLTQPPFAASAMDGYAVRFQDAKKDACLQVIGEAPAGQPFAGAVDPQTTVRIFTGAVVPAGADHVVIQEDVSRNGDAITISVPQRAPANIRSKGIDFMVGDQLADAGDSLHEIHGSIFAAANIAAVDVVRRPKLAIFANGDELHDPGGDLPPGAIVNSNHYALTAMAESWGADVTYLGCAKDDEAAIVEFFKRGSDADIIVPVGGASVGDHDYVKSAFAKAGGIVAFEKIAVRPGKPTWFGKMHTSRVVGLPGNPASAIVTAGLFLQPLVKALAGRRLSDTSPHSSSHSPFYPAITQAALKENGPREAYLRAVAERAGDGIQVRAIDNQDSSLLLPFAKANALIRRPSHAPDVAEGGMVEIIWLR